MHSDSKDWRAEAIAELSRLLREGLALQAYELVKSRHLGELRGWTGVDERILGGRLLTPLGAPRQAEVMHYKAYRHHPQHGEAALYFAFSYLSRFGVLRTLPHVRRALELPALDDATRADLLALRGYLFGALRDFSFAHADIDAAIALQPERPWLWAERSSVLRMEDRYAEALEASQHALELRPHYRVAIEQVADLLYLTNRDDEAIGLLEEAAERSEMSYIVGRLSAYYSELGQIDKALGALDRYEVLTPLAEKHVKQWLARRRSDLLYLKGDLKGVIALSAATGSKYHRRIAKRLEGGKHAGGKRVKLPVGFVRQHEMTCAPATLTAIAAYWGQQANHLELAEEICYDGTPGHSERNWAETNGYIVKEFRVGWEVAVALIDRGIPFTLTTVETTSAHLQALIGYDAQIGVFLIRDPTHKHFGEFRAKAFLKQYEASGPRGMVFVPRAKAGLLDGIEFPEAELYDHMHALQRALEAHDRAAAEAQLGVLQEIAPGHRMALSGERALASYDGDTPGVVAALDKLIARYPKHQGFHLSKFGNMRALWSWEEKCDFVRKQLAKKKFDPVYLRELGGLLADDARYYGDALYYLRRGLQRRARDAELLHSMAGIYWDQGKLVEATELYRFATCLEPTWEYLADSYFKATRFLRQGDEGLAFLRARFVRLGAKSASPAMTLFDAYSTLERVAEGLEMLDVALQLRPDDGALMLFASGKHSAYNRLDRAAELLEAARRTSSELAWLRESARQATRRGALEEAEGLWSRVIAAQPLAMDAQRSYVRVLAEARGHEVALAHLGGACASYPNHVPLHELYIGWLNDDGPVAAEPVIRHVLAISPTNNWARRELVLNLNRQGRDEEALAEGELMLAAAPHESYSHSIAGYVLRGSGDDVRAAACFRRALELSADNHNAVRGLVGCGKSDAERREALQFVAAELKRQVLFGEALQAFRDEAFPILEPEELLGLLREIHAERPDLWQSWSVLIEQLKATGAGGEALEVARGMIARFPLLPRAYLELAEVHEHLGETAETIAALEDALGVNPHWDYAMRQLGEAYQKHGDFENARQVLARAVEEDPLAGQNHGYLAEVLWKLGEREAAFESMVKAITVQPTYRWGWETLGEYAIELQREEEAIERAKALTEMRGLEVSSWEVLADMYGNFERREEQLGALDRGVEVRPRRSDLYDAKAFVLTRLGRYDEAEAACRPEVFGEQVPRQLKGREAWVRWERGGRSEALRMMEALVEEEPDYFWAIKTLCEWCGDEEAHDKALIWAPRLVRLAPDDAIAHGYVAHALIESDRKAESLEHLERACQLDPTYSFAANRVFDFKLEAGDLDGAEQALERLLVHLPGRYALGRKVRLAAKRGDLDGAFATHAEICRDEAVSAGTLEWAERALREASDEPRTLAHYEAVVAGGGAALGAVERWVKLAVDAGKPRVYEKFAGLGAGPASQHRAWAAYFETLALGDAKRRKRALPVWRKRRAELRGPTEVWEQVGFFLNSACKYRESVAWMSDWRQRDGLSQWALEQVARGIEAATGLAEAIPVRRHALENLAADHTAGAHRTMVALSVAEQQEGDEFDALVGGVEHGGLGDSYTFCYEMAHVLHGLSRGGERRAAKAAGFKAYRRAVEAEEAWDEYAALVRVYHFVAARSLRRAMPSLLGCKLFLGMANTFLTSAKK